MQRSEKDRDTGILKKLQISGELTYLAVNHLPLPSPFFKSLIDVKCGSGRIERILVDVGLAFFRWYGPMPAHLDDISRFPGILYRCDVSIIRTAAPCFCRPIQEEIVESDDGRILA